jgi:beta-aspartyl-peptidase (threonine type)
MALLGEGSQQAADAVIAEIGALGGDGGVIVAGADGSTAFALNTAGMYRGRADSEGLREVKIFGEE